MEKVSYKRKTRGTRKCDGTRGSAQQAIYEPKNALEDLASVLRTAQDKCHGCYSNDCKDKKTLTDAMNNLQDVLNAGTSDNRAKGSVHAG